MTKLPSRLQSIADLIEPCAVFADVGCDHGLMSLYVLDKWLANRVLCIDKSLKCLEKTIKLLKRHKLDDQAIFYNCDGLYPVRQVPDEVLIAGLGGAEIIDILYQYSRTRPLDTIETLILQPMRDDYAVRKWLNTNGFIITHDFIKKDKKLYRIIKAKRGVEKLTEEQLMFGACEGGYNSLDYLEWLYMYLDKCVRILGDAGRAKKLAVTTSLHDTIAKLRKQIKYVEDNYVKGNTSISKIRRKPN